MAAADAQFVRPWALELLMRLLYLASAGIGLAACTHNSSSMPSPAGSVSSFEYDLYAMVIKKQHTAIFTPDSTTPVICQPADPWDPCQLHGSGPDPEAWIAFIEVNKSAVAIDSGELARRGIRMVGPFSERALRVCPPGPALFDLSRVGFNHDSTEAVLRSGAAAGKGPFEGCGYSAGETSLYRRGTDGSWKWVRIFSSSAS